MDLDVESLAPRTAIGVGLLAVIPALWYAIARPSTWGFLSVVSILVIVGALYLAMEPVERAKGPNPNHAP